MRIAVTGGAGFIGSAFARHMMKRDDVESLAVFDALTYAARIDNLASIRSDRRFSFIKGDIRDRDAVCSLIRQYRPDIIVNFAAESHVDRSIADPGIFISTNIAGTGVLLDAALDAGIRRFHQVSTDEVYGDTAIEDKKKFSEHSPLSPSSPYSASKAAADLLCLSYRRTYGLPVTISRCTNNFGLGQHEEKLIPKAVSLAMAGKSIPIYGSGKNKREWIAADDHSEAIEWIIRNGRDGEIYKHMYAAKLTSVMDNAVETTFSDGTEGKGVYSYGETTLDDNEGIPEHTTFTIGGVNGVESEFNIPEGLKLTNKGNFLVRENSTFDNDGSFDNDGNAEVIRIVLIVILTVLALVILGVYLYLLPWEKYRKNKK